MNTQHLYKAHVPTIESFSRMIFAIQVDTLHGGELKLHNNVNLVTQLLNEIRADAIRSSSRFTRRLVRIHVCVDTWALNRAEKFVQSHSVTNSQLHSWVHVLDHADKDFQEAYYFLLNDGEKESFYVWLSYLSRMTSRRPFIIDTKRSRTAYSPR